KKTRVANFHGQTLKAFAELMGACGLSNTSDIRRSHIYHRAATGTVVDYESLYPSAIASSSVTRRAPNAERFLEAPSSF
ncbi:MAG: hypothetical protein RBT63_05795, partial [Bdellovibrionales bacterium]|nr:hypothetical protein [Bdellovibrionales bacterium]